MGGRNVNLVLILFDFFSLFLIVILNPADFDFLLSKGDPTSHAAKCRDSLLERFDPLLGPRHSILPPPPQSLIANANKQFSIIEEADSLNDSAAAAIESPVLQHTFKVPKEPKELKAAVVDKGIAGLKEKVTKLDSDPSPLGHLDEDSQPTSTSSSSETYATAPTELTNSVSRDAMHAFVFWKWWFTIKLIFSLQIGKDNETTTMSVGLIQDMNNENMKSLDLVR